MLAGLIAQTDMNEKRLMVVKHAWAALTEGKGGSLSVEELRARFYPGAHPRVKARQKTGAQVAEEFVEGMGQHAEAGGAVDEKGFLEFYADLNALLPETHEDYFCNTVIDTWGLKGAPTMVGAAQMEKIEDYVFEKIRQRTHGVEDEGRTAKKFFKFFDLNESGVLEYDEFCKALAAAGAQLRDHEIRALFDKYDSDRSGKMNYSEFAGFLRARSSGRASHLSPTMAMTKRAPEDVLAKVRKELLRRGAHGIRGLGIVFRRMDDSGNRKLDRHEFEWGLKENGHSLSRAVSASSSS